MNICYAPGALHIHTTFSDGSGTPEHVIRCAQQAGLRWIIITDHDDLRARDYAGWHAGLLVIAGHEITPQRNHFLALNTFGVVSNALPPQQFVDEVYAQGGFGIIAHPDEQVHNRFKEIYRWDDWRVDGPTARAGRPVGLELWNAMSDWGEHLTDRNATLNFLLPRRGLSGPTPATLAWWDRLNMAGRRTFGVGGVDVHAFQKRLLGRTLEVFRYDWMFGTLTNYLLLDRDLDADPAIATNQVYAALAAGRSYFVNRLDGPCPGLVFQAEQGGVQYGSGDSPDLRAGPVTFAADAGCDCDLRLVYNGQTLVGGVRALRETVAQPGVYRLEGHRRARQWLFANPIYVI